MLTLVNTELVDNKVLSWGQVVEKLAVNPAKIFGLEGRGTIKAGSIADITVIDPDIEYIFSAKDFVSKSKNSPFIGRKLKGRAEVTIVGGKIAWPIKE